MLTPALIGNIRAFLNRVQLTGAEVAAFNEVQIALSVEESQYKATGGSVDTQGPADASNVVALQAASGG